MSKDIPYIQCLPFAIGIFDRCGKLKHCNERFNAFFGEFGINISVSDTYKQLLKPLIELSFVNRKEQNDFLQKRSENYNARHSETFEIQADFSWVVQFELHFTETDEAVLTCKDLSEQSLRESLFNDAEKLAKVGTWEYNFDSGLIFLSKNAWDILGPDSKNQMSTMSSLFEFIYKEDISKVEKEIAHAFESTMPFEFNYRLYRTDKELIHINAKGKTFLDKHQKPVVARGVFKDVTEITLAQNALKESQLTLSAIVNTTPDILCLLGEDKRFLFCNASSKKLLKYNTVDLLGKTYLDFVHSDDVAKVDQAFKSIVEQEKKLATVEFRFLQKGGKWIDLEIVASNQLSNETIRAIVINARDITERKALEEQLLHAQKIETIGQLTAGIAHDFRNSLSIINGFGSLLKLSCDPQSSKYHYLDKILYTTQRTTNLIHQLMAFSRKQVSKPQVLNVNDSIRRIESMLSRLIYDEVELDFKLNFDVGNIEIDPVHFEQIIINLVVNARDAIEKTGRITIQTSKYKPKEQTCELDQKLFGGKYVIIEVSDTGKGISDECKEKIFDPFFTTKQESQGTGLGLAIVKKIVSDNHGFIFFETQFEKGTTFSIYFESSQKPISEDLRYSVEEYLPKGSETILVVEDDDHFRLYMKEFLNILGYNVIEANSGLQALEIYNKPEQPIHMVLSDVYMPDLNGKLLYEKLKVLKPEMRFILMTADSDSELEHLSSNDSKTWFVQKPFQSNYFASVLRKCLDC